MSSTVIGSSTGKGHLTEGDLLIICVIGGNLKQVEFLVETFKDRDLKNYQDINGKTPLMYAIEHGKREIIEYLLRSGANTKIIGEDHSGNSVNALYYEDTWNRNHPNDQMNYIREIGNVLGGVFGEFSLREPSQTGGDGGKKRRTKKSKNKKSKKRRRKVMSKRR